MSTQIPFCLSSFEMIDFKKTKRVEITLYWQTHTHSYELHTLEHINTYAYIYICTSGMTINNKTIYEETVKYFRIRTSIISPREVYSKTPSSLNAQSNVKCESRTYINT